MADRLFTRDEAEAELAEVGPIAERMVSAWHELEAARAEQERLERGIRGNGGGIPPQELAAAQTGIERAASAVAAEVDQIQARGVLVKDLETGLLDFPSLRDGEQVLLCWRVGEPGIGYWHGVDEGFAGRKPL